MCILVDRGTNSGFVHSSCRGDAIGGITKTTESIEPEVLEHNLQCWRTEFHDENELINYLNKRKQEMKINCPSTETHRGANFFLHIHKSLNC